MPAMGLAEDIARVRARARGAEINARHRRSKEVARRVSAAMGAPAPADGVHPDFAKTLDAARARAKEAMTAAEAPHRAPVDRIQQLVLEGKLPPRPGDHGVGYEPTPEEVLGDLTEPPAPDGTEDLPDAASVLEDSPMAAAGGWGEAPGAVLRQPAAEAPSAPPLARGAPSVHPKRKRGR